jgi:hypothetical protein
MFFSILLTLEQEMESDRTAKIKTDFFINTPDEEYSSQFLDHGRCGGRDYLALFIF